ncbi:type I-E CRISPR-associated endonuclease Cas1e [Rothia kristinae]|uniref:type I-E CRISPR-associated endonuclease Cas1e n=1 Tax=Rothia kristinae TaxID=37923 RepID=UPI0021A703DD|nr:type I-E CRISPR-associated endonuclease Cas1e [Rothia kristinae]MCT1357797.1 type I-E CRISPR-associated endonuclease Cas1e [Rothia kristinae]MCT1393630.1 type I-E CRISPR-associated endonuclease Cas1e [Rothia kristinae]MCT1506653.1 type I-E CRISPR-associated endonuclease Cas1e [Rothia kristinae]MCT2243655.1 type I-E CRISPR-associated endonuclease Cas1e [Rothia kristinae]
MVLSGTAPPTRQELGRVGDRFSFVYVERCTVHRDANAITAADQEGVTHIPAATLGCLLLGPGTRMTHAAMSLLGDCGASVVWVGENGVRYYAHGQSLAKSSRLLIAQARLVSNTRSRLAVARAMYSARFPGEDVSGLTMQQLRGREGSRIRRVYREHAQRTGVTWGKREYTAGECEDSDAINQALTFANAALYGVVHSVIVAMGCSPGLGFVHTGTDRSFVFDVADLYKAQVTIPAAFDAVAEKAEPLSGAVRRKVRDGVVRHRLLERCARDLTELLLPGAEGEWDRDDTLSLWSGAGEGGVVAGKNYAAGDPDLEESSFPEDKGKPS